ncbi:hypothetical protein ACWEH1_34025, partial [Micromonospora chersina]
MITVAGIVDAVGAALLKVVVAAGAAEVRDVTLAELDEAPTGQSGDLAGDRARRPDRPRPGRDHAGGPAGAAPPAGRR